MLSYANTSISELFNNFALNTTFDFSLQFITNLKFISLILLINKKHSGCYQVIIYI